MFPRQVLVGLESPPDLSKLLQSFCFRVEVSSVLRGLEGILGLVCCLASQICLEFVGTVEGLIEEL